MIRLKRKFLLISFLLVSCNGPTFLPPVKTIDHLPNKPLYPFLFWSWKLDDFGMKNRRLVQEGVTGESQPIKKEEKPLVDLDKANLCLYVPPTQWRGTSLGYSLPMTSTDGKWTIQTYAVRTFAEDLKNIRLIVKNSSGETGQVVVPEFATGEVYPLFWNPRKSLFYFMVAVEDEPIRSYRLWEFEPSNEQFKDVGESDGRAFTSPDGNWVLWETGRAIAPCSLKGKFCTDLMVYDTENHLNYRISDGKTTNVFQRWVDQ